MTSLALLKLHHWFDETRFGGRPPWRRRRRFPFLRNVLARPGDSRSKRALLHYIVPPFLNRVQGTRLPTHQNQRQAPRIAAALDELGYLVDVADSRVGADAPRGPYDLVLSSHTTPLPAFSEQFGDAVRLYLATTTGHRAHNRALRQRQASLSERRGRTVKLRRNYREDTPYVASAAAIIGFGNSTVLNTWAEHSQAPRFPFNNYGFRELVFEVRGRPATTRKNFLYYASGSQLQKGLDLLLEIFPKYPDLHLYVASAFQREYDFCIIYHRELYRTPNIHPLGWIDVNDGRFRDLLERCGSVILPTCSEGQPGSVVQCMHAGLIPLVTKQAGLDTADFGVTFADDRLETIERGILEVANAPERWHRAQALATRDVARVQYSESAFEARWQEILAAVLQDPAPRSLTAQPRDAVPRSDEP